MSDRNDWLTVAAIGVLAMCLVTFDHEALGHGSACLLLHGHISVLTSSLFRCDVRSGWIDPAGPASNLLMGTLALVFLRFVPERFRGLKLFLIALTALSYFWEGGYLMRAMARRDGDLYFFAQYLLGDVAPWERIAAAAAGLALYVATARLTSAALLRLWPEADIARSVARIVWLSATLGAAFAALFYRGQGWGDLTDSVLEIGAASLPLLFVPLASSGARASQSPVFLTRSYAAIGLSAAVYGTFVATLGRGVAL